MPNEIEDQGGGFDRQRIGRDNLVLRGRAPAPQIASRASIVRPAPREPDRPADKQPARITIEGITLPLITTPPEASPEHVYFRPKESSAVDRPEPIPTLPVQVVKQPSPEIPPPVGEPAVSGPPLNNTLSSNIPTQPEKTTKRFFGLSGRFTRLEKGLATAAVLLLVAGVFVSVQTMKTNHRLAAQVIALTKNSATAQVVVTSAAPNIIPPSLNDVTGYNVAPDQPRYLNIPKLGINARVLPVSSTAQGLIGTPDNIFDTGWYTASAKPGQTGATVIDGDIASQTTHGVFYQLKNLQVGDTLHIIRGDNTVLSYQVAKVQTVAANSVDIKALTAPITPGVSGLNLISCLEGATVGTVGYNVQVVVFAKQV
jgi:LPXTG-site transpeptidase (sortase) family protein